MKVSLSIILSISVFLMIDARSIGVDDKTPKVLKDTYDQSFQCTLKLALKATNLPPIRGIEQLPENNPTLNKLWGCIWNKKGIMDEDSTLHVNKLEEYLTDLASIAGKPSAAELDEVHDIVEHCKNVDDDDYGLKSVKIQNCINRYVSENNLRR